MKKLIAALTLFVGLSANANLLSVSVSDTNVSVGESLDVIVMADMTAPFSSLDFHLDFDTSLFDEPTGFSSDFSSLVSDPLNLAINYFSGGWVAFSMFDFTNFDAGIYEAARFTLTAKAASGATSFSFDDLTIFALNSDVEDLGLSPDPITGNASVAVSAPATLGLFAVALFGLVSLRRKA